MSLIPRSNIRSWFQPAFVAASIFAFFYVFDPANSSQRGAAESSPAVTMHNRRDGHDLSADGLRIVAALPEYPANELLFWDRADGTQAIIRHQNPDARLFHPAISHDGSQIAFVVADTPRNSVSEIYLFDVSEMAVTAVISEFCRAFQRPEFIFDGEQIIFARDTRAVTENSSLAYCRTRDISDWGFFTYDFRDGEVYQIADTTFMSVFRVMEQDSSHYWVEVWGELVPRQGGSLGPCYGVSHRGHDCTDVFTLSSEFQPGALSEFRFETFGTINRRFPSSRNRPIDHIANNATAFLIPSASDGSYSPQIAIVDSAGEIVADYELFPPPQYMEISDSGLTLLGSHQLHHSDALGDSTDRIILYELDVDEEAFREALVLDYPIEPTIVLIE